MEVRGLSRPGNRRNSSLKRVLIIKHIALHILASKNVRHFALEAVVTQPKKMGDDLRTVQNQIWIRIQQSL